MLEDWGSVVPGAGLGEVTGSRILDGLEIVEGLGG